MSFVQRYGPLLDLQRERRSRRPVLRELLGVGALPGLQRIGSEVRRFSCLSPGQTRPALASL